MFGSNQILYSYGIFLRVLDSYRISINIFWIQPYSIRKTNKICYTTYMRCFWQSISWPAQMIKLRIAPTSTATSVCQYPRLIYEAVCGDGFAAVDFGKPNGRGRHLGEPCEMRQQFGERQRRDLKQKAALLRRYEPLICRPTTRAQPHWSKHSVLSVSASLPSAKSW